MVAGPFKVMNSDARHRKEFSTENTLGGDSVLPCGRQQLLLSAAVGQLCATTPLVALFRPKRLLAALFEASSPIHEDRNGLPQSAAAIL